MAMMICCVATLSGTLDWPTRSGQRASDASRRLFGTAQHGLGARRLRRLLF
jgi:hypothetical protein